MEQKQMTTKEKKLAKMWCQLNRWEWPKELERQKPKWWSNPKDHDRKMSVAMPIMKAIEMMIGIKKCLQIWRQGQKAI